MPEPDVFEHGLQTALRAFAERGVVPVDADEFAARIAGQARTTYPEGWATIGRLAWLLLAVALLVVLLASVLIVGAQPTDDRAVLVRVFEPRDVGAVAFSADGESLAAWEGTDLVLLDLDTGNVRMRLRSSVETWDKVHDIAVSPDGGLIAAVSGQCGSEAARVRVWDAGSGELLLQRLDDFEHIVTSVAFSPDGTRLVVGTGCIFRVRGSAFVKAWDIASGAQLLDIAMPRFVEDVEFSPDGAVVAAADDMTVSLWDAATGGRLVKLGLGFDSSSSSSRVAFAPDGTWLASTGGDARVWDTESGEGSYRLEEPASGLQDVVIRPDGRTVVGCGDDGVRVWDAVTGTLQSEVAVDRTRLGARPGAHETQCRLAFQGGDTLLATFGYGQDLRLWRVQ